MSIRGVAIVCGLSMALPAAATKPMLATIPARVTMIDGDTTPARTAGPGAITSGIVALDYNHRSIFVELQKQQIVRRIVLKSDPRVHRAGTSNENLPAGRLELYISRDNKHFQKVAFAYQAPDQDTVILDGFSLRAKYLKIHATCGRATDYRFVNHLGKMVPTFARPATQVWGRPYLSDKKLAAVHGKNYHDLKDPLFEELFGDVPAPKRVLYWSGNCDDELGRLRPWFRAHARKFGYRYVFEEQLAETAKHHLVYSGKVTPWLARHNIPTWRFIIGDPGRPFVPSIDGMPMVFGTQGWLMDRRWRNQYFKQAVERAQAKQQWALSAGDETWEVFAIKPVPKDQWYDQVVEADKQIREKYGFGQYGMPTAEEDGKADPFDRIAHRRWVSDKLTELFKKTYEAVKEVSPETVMLGPDFASGVPAGDIEAWAPYFDIFTAQCSNAPTPFAGRFCVGCDTKVLADLSGKPAWMAVQNATPAEYGYTKTPEFIREMYSQVFRNGGSGIFLLASEWYEREFNHPKYAEPAKWRALLHVVDTIQKMNLPKLPEPDGAILYSSDSLLTLRWAQLNNGNWELYSAYTALGPLLRSWFHIVSDRQIDRGIRDLSRYKVLYIPFAEYQRASVLAKIAAYAEQGGTVVCSDPEAFTWDINGASLSGAWEKLSGVRRVGKRSGDATSKTVAPNPLPLTKRLLLPTLSPAWRIEPLDGRTRTVAVFDDGSPAVTVHDYGKGRVIFFAADPLAMPGGWGASKSLVEPAAPIVTLFEAIQKHVGAKMGHDIWRFKLPPFPGDMYQKQTGRCLTNNYVYDRNKPYLEKNNRDVGGTYSYSRAPTGVPDVAGAATPISFDRGHLTNRLKAYRTRHTQDSSALANRAWKEKTFDRIARPYIVSWTDRPAVAITFDFKGARPVRKIRLFYSATMPALRVLGSEDGDKWQDLAAIPEESAGQDVKDVVVPVAGTWRYLKLNFADRQAGEQFLLCEVEVWGSEARPGSQGASR